MDIERNGGRIRVRDERLSSINPYFPRENGGCVYPYFFDMMVDGKPILDTLDAMYRSQNIEDFMRAATPIVKSMSSNSENYSKVRGVVLA